MFLQIFTKISILQKIFLQKYFSIISIAPQGNYRGNLSSSKICCDKIQWQNLSKQTFNFVLIKLSIRIKFFIFSLFFILAKMLIFFVKKYF